MSKQHIVVKTLISKTGLGLTPPNNNDILFFDFFPPNHESNYLSWYFVSAQKLD